MIEIKCACIEKCNIKTMIDENIMGQRILKCSCGVGVVLPQWLSDAIIKAYNEQEESGVSDDNE